MDIQLQNILDKFSHDSNSVFAAIALLILNTDQFEIIEQRDEILKQLQKLVDSSEKRGLTFIDRGNKDEIKKSLEICISEVKMSFPDSSLEITYLLACLKLLKDNKKSTSYSKVLKQILKKNLHKQLSNSTQEKFIGREEELEKIHRVLSRSQRNNILIVGNFGVGKTTLSRQVRFHMPEFKLYEVYPDSENSFFDTVIQILSVTSGLKPLFFLDEIFIFPQQHIKFLLENGQIIATANSSSYKKIASEYPHIISKFEILELEEPTHDEVITILKTHAPTVQHDVLDEVYSLAKKYISDQSFPMKGILLLEESITFAQKENTELDVRIIQTVIAQKTNIPIASMSDLEKKDLATLGDRLNSKVKGQDEAVKKVAGVIQRSRIGFKRGTRPIGSFLFIGPSGVGKTELAKAVASEVFGDAESVVRMDMSEFSEAHMVQRLIGSPPGYVGYEEGGQLTNPVKKKPYTLVLLDEIEKAHPRVFDIFLQVLDDGRLTDGKGEKVDFQNTIIIATSNAGIEDMLDMLAEGKTHDEIVPEIKEVLQDYFRIEFINRFDEIIIFNPLSVEALVGIAKLHLAKLQAELKKRDIEFSIRDEVILKLAEEGHNPLYGARGLLRLLQEKIENTLAEMIVQDQLKPGQRVEF